MSDETPTPIAGSAAEPPAASEVLEARLRETTGLLAVARVVSSTTDLPEALRLICRELGRLTGAETVSAYLHDGRTSLLRPIAAHGVPKHAVEALSTTALSLDEPAVAEGLFSHAQVVWSEDVAADPRFAAQPFKRFPHQAGLVIPIVLDGKISGAFHLIWWERRRRFDAAELAPLQIIGEQAGILLNHARLRDALEGRAVRLRALSRVNQVVSSSLDESEVLGTIARAAAEMMGAPFVSFWVADEVTHTVTRRAVSDEAMAEGLPAAPVAYGEGALGWIAERRQSLDVPDVTRDERFVLRDWWAARGLRSFLGVPVMLEGSLLAVLAISGRAPLHPGPDERELLESFVAQAAVAVRNMRLYAEAALYANRLETLTSLSRTLTASLDPETILPAVVDAALTLFPGGACQLWTLEGDRLRLRAESGEERGGQRRRPPELALGEGVVGEVAATGRSILVDDLAARLTTTPDPSLAPAFVKAGMVSAATLPLLVGGQAIGVVCLMSATRRSFTPGEIKVMEAFAEHAAVALTKARLFQDIQDRRKVSEDLYTLTVGMMRSMDVQQRIDTFVRGAREALNFDRISVLLADADEHTFVVAASSDAEAAGRRVLPIAGSGALEQAWTSGQTIMVLTDADLATLSPLGPDLREHPLLRLRRFAVVPLRFQERSIGVVLVDNKTSRRQIMRRGVAQLELFCQQLQNLVSNARLWAETQRRERDATLLLDVTRRLSSTLDLEQVLDIITESTLGVLECDASGFYRWDAARDGLVFVRGRHVPDSMTRAVILRSGEGVSGRAFAERKPCWTADAHADPALGYSQATREAMSVEGLAAAALLNDAARTLHRTLDARRLLPDALASLGQTFSAVGAAVMLFGDTGTVQAKVIRWGTLPEDAVRALAEPLRRREAPLLVPDVTARTELLPEGLLEPGPRGLAAFPVRGRSRVLGGLVLVFAGPRSLYEAETRLLAAYADQLAMALDNAALFEEAENKKTQLEQVFASTTDGFLVADLSGRIVAFNRQGGDLLGISPDDVIGRPFHRLVETLGPAVGWETPGGQALENVIAGGRPEAALGDLDVRTPEPRTLGWRAAPMRDLLGAAVGVTITFHDVTRQREIDRMKTEFVSTVSHELRTPLTSIKGSLHLLLSDPSLTLDNTQRQLIDISVKNTDRLIRLITNILDISKIEAGHIQLDLGPHRVDEFVSVAVDGIAAFAESRGITITVDTDAGLPSLKVDVDRMVQVVTNLLSNAIKFSPPGGGVRVTVKATGRQAELRVRDQGRGIAAEDMGKLFKKFQQLDGSNVRSVGGTGLGLAICRGIVEEHGGSIGVESQLGQGATFIVKLPLPAVEAVAPADRESGVPGGPLLLVVDDEPDIRMLLRDQLELEGFRVLEAGRALEAVELARARLPDLITMDLMLPDLDGFEAIRLLRENERTRETPVIILSAIELGDDDTRALGPTVHLAKPFSSADLLATIRANLRLDRSVGR